MGSFAGNLAVSGAMYGAIGALTYDSQTTDPYNHAMKIGAGFLIDQAVDIGIMGVGGAFSKAYKAGTNRLGRGNRQIIEPGSRLLGGDILTGRYRAFDPNDILGTGRTSLMKTVGDRLTKFGAQVTGAGAAVSMTGGAAMGLSPLGAGVVSSEVANRYQSHMNKQFLSKAKFTPAIGSGQVGGAPLMGKMGKMPTAPGRGLVRFLGGIAGQGVMAGTGVVAGVTGAVGTTVGAGITGIGATMSVAGRMSKPIDWAMRRAGGIGLAAHMALGFMGLDPASIFMSTWENAEQKYRSSVRRQPSQLTHASSRYVQDQLFSMRGAGNEAEIMHN